MKKWDAKDIKSIVDECKQGNDRARKALFDIYSETMLALCIRYLGNRDDAQDVMLIGFMKVYENIDKYSHYNFDGWIYKIMINECCTFLKKRKHNITFDENFEQEYFPNTTNIDNPERFTKKDLLDALQSLTPRLRIVFNMIAIDSYSYKDVADELNTTINTVKTAMNLARKKLKASLLNIEEMKTKGKK